MTDPRMTDPRMTTTDAPVTVNDEDREAAVDLAHALGMECETFTEGAADILVQHLARHRLAALASAPAGDGERDMLRDAYVAGFEQALHNTSLTPDAFFDGWVYVGGCPAPDTKRDEPCAALARPRAAVGEQSREAGLRYAMNEAKRTLSLVQGCLECNADDERRWAETIVWLERLALQSPPAKVE